MAQLPTPSWVEVPQRAYGHGRRQWDFRPSEPIPFNVNCLPGINMRDALRKHFVGLEGRDDPMFEEAAGAISCRLLVWWFSQFLPRIGADVVPSFLGIHQTAQPR